MLLLLSCLVLGVYSAPSHGQLRPEIENLSLKNEKGPMLGATKMYCENPNYYVSTYNSRTFSYYGCCPEGHALMCNDWDAIISGGCCDTSKYDYMNCSWWGFGECKCYSNNDDVEPGEPLRFDEPIRR